MSDVFIVVFGGGYEAPSYQAFGSESEAWDESERLLVDLKEDEGDIIDVLRLDLTTLSLTRLTPTTPETSNGS